MSTDPNSPSTPADSATHAAPAEPPKPSPLSVRRPIQVGSRRHFTSNDAPAPPAPAPASVKTPPPPAPVRPNAPASPAADPTTTAPPAAAPPPTGPLAAEPPVVLAPQSNPRPGSGSKSTADKATASTRELARPALPPKPSKRDQLSADLEQEIDAALGGLSLDAVLGGAALATSEGMLEADTRRHAAVVRVHGDDVFFALDDRNEGVVSARQFKTPPNAGESFDVIVKGFNADDGLYELHVPGASIEISDWSDLSEGSIVEAKVTAANTGGLECEVNKLRGFIPASQISMYRVENLEQFVDQKLLCVVTEANPQRRNLVLSHRAVLEREKEEGRQKFFAELEVGQTREGIVRKIHDFGAFVDLGSADGLIHISQLSWDRVKHPSEILQEGQKVQVRIEKFDPETGRIGLSYRNLQEQPWTNAESKFPVGSTVKGTVSRLANFGAFVKLAPGIEGLIHVSELAHYRVTNVGRVVQEGQDVEVKVLSVDAEQQRIGLSLKALLAAPEPKKGEGSEAEPDAPPQPLINPKRPGPLRGGVDRPNGGEGIGLNW